MGWLYDEFYIIIAVVEELITEGRLSGTLSGLNEGKPVYIPAIYSQAQKAWVHSFYTQNGYLGNKIPCTIFFGKVGIKVAMQNTNLHGHDHLCWN